MRLRRFWLLTFSSLLLLMFVGGDNFSEAVAINVVSTDKESYAAGETITVIGQVATKYGDMTVQLITLAPNGNIVEIHQLDVDSENNFGVDVQSSISGVWEQTGTYLILAQYNEIKFETQFDFGKTYSAEVKSADETGSFDISPVEKFESGASILQLENYDIVYDISGAKILAIVPDTENKSLIIQIETSSDGELKITIPRGVLDSDEGSFFVIIDGEQTEHISEATSDSWTLIIPFYHGSEEIEIIGTFVIPEFGLITMTVLIVGIISVIVFSAKSKLNIIPKL